jgi:hypothetical protein
LGVHVLVCEAFHGPRPPGADLVAHADGDPGNNEAANLRWATHAENEGDKRRHGRSMLGERNHQAVLTELDVREIRLRHASGESPSSIARDYSVSYRQVYGVCRGESWRHIA